MIDHELEKTPHLALAGFCAADDSADLCAGFNTLSAARARLDHSERFLHTLYGIGWRHPERVFEHLCTLYYPGRTKRDRRTDAQSLPGHRSTVDDQPDCFFLVLVQKTRLAFCFLYAFRGVGALWLYRSLGNHAHLCCIPWSLFYWPSWWLAARFVFIFFSHSLKAALRLWGFFTPIFRAASALEAA